jgi:hypothetical protein
MERVANLGYCLIKEETTPGTPVTPTIVLPLYEEDVTTDMNVDSDNPIVGIRSARLQTLPGMRSHGGSMTVMAEPNTALYCFSMMLKRGNVSGSGPYTWGFTEEPPTSSYTVDFAKGQMVHRFWGMKASSINPSFDENQMRFEMDVAALGSFTVRELSGAPTGSGPYTVTLKTDYTDEPTKGLVVGDLIRFYDVSANATIDATVASVVNATQITTSTNVSTLTAGDFVYLRPQTPTMNLKTPFLLTRTYVHFGADATAAFSAAQTKVDEIEWTLMHNFAEDEGQHRTGGADPAAVVHTQTDAELSVTRYFDVPSDYNDFLALKKRAAIIRHYSETGYELRITLNNLRGREQNQPLESGELIMSEQEWQANYDTADAKMFAVTVINGLSAA